MEKYFKIIAMVLIIASVSMLNMNEASAAEKPKFADADKVNALYLSGETKKAKELMLKAPENQRDIGWYGFMIHLQIRLGESKDAEITAKASISRYPKESSLYLSLASAYSAQKEYEKALETIEQARAFAAQDKKERGWVLDEKARIYKSMGEYEKAKKTYDELLQFDAGNINYILNSMMIESALGNYSICSARFEKAKADGISPYGENVGIQFLSIAAYHSGNNEDAKKHTRQLRMKNTGTFNSEIAFMSFVLDYEADAVIEMLRGTQPPGGDTTSIYYAGLKARKGDEAMLNNILAKWSELTAGELEALAIVLVHLKYQEALVVAQNLYEKNPRDPDYNYLLAFAHKNSGKDYRKYSEYAISKAPNNKVYGALLKGGNDTGQRQ